MTVALLAEPSVAWYVNESVPLKSPFGVYVNEPSALRASVPFATSLSSTAVSASPSTSESLVNTLSPVSVPSSSTEYASSTASGGSLTGLTLIVTVAASQNSVPSNAR